MAEKDGCHICGDCWWHECNNPADYSMDVDLKRGGLPLFSGKVELCGGHTRYVHENGGRMDLDPVAIEQASAIQKARL